MDSSAFADAETYESILKDIMKKDKFDLNINAYRSQKTLQYLQSLDADPQGWIELEIYNHWQNSLTSCFEEKTNFVSYLFLSCHKNNVEALFKAAQSLPGTHVSLEFLERASSLNHVKSIEEIAQYYRNIGKDLKKSVQFYQKAAHLGSEMAQRELTVEPLKSMSELMNEVEDLRAMTEFSKMDWDVVFCKEVKSYLVQS